MNAPRLGPGLIAIMLGLTLAGAAWPQPTPQPPPMSPVPPGSGAEQSPALDLIQGDFTLHRREDRLGAVLDRSVADHALGQAEYGRASRALADIRASEDRLRARHNGELTDSETFRLEGRLKTLAASLHWKPWER
jgi:hypothetical protein